MLDKCKCSVVICITLVLVFFSACSNQTTTEQKDNSSKIINTQPSEVVADDKINVYGGPGDDYIKITSISQKQIKKTIKYENEWIEVDYGDKRGYVKANECDNIDVNKIPHVVYSMNSNIYPYPTIYNTKIELSLFDEANVYSIPKSSGSPITIGEKENIIILCQEKSALKDYIQIEFITDRGKRRGW